MPVFRPDNPNRARAALGFGAASGLVAMTAVYLTSPWEGKANVAYWDRLGKVWTVCYGETKGVTRNTTMTDEQCRKQLYVRLERDYHRPLQVCIRNFDTLPLGLQASLLDAAYNVGVGTICHSTAAKRARARDYAGACEATAWFDRAGGHVVSGLRKRRTNGDASRMGERELCLASIKDTNQ